MLPFVTLTDGKDGQMKIASNLEVSLTSSLGRSAVNDAHRQGYAWTSTLVKS